MTTNRPLLQIPTHVIAGPLGAGKTTFMRALLEQRPQGERWAILVNEFGQVGIDQALLGTADDSNVSISEIPGGCLCCVNGVPFQVGLGRLLRRARPDRLFIETSGLGHPAPLLEQLGEAPWKTVLQLQPLIMVVDAAALATGQMLPHTQSEALHLAGALIMNKSEALDDHDRQRLAQALPKVPLLWCTQGWLPFTALPQKKEPAAAQHVPDNELPDGPSPLPLLWTPNQQWQRREQRSEAGCSIGWLVHPSIRFDSAAVIAWLTDIRWLRAKAVMHTEAGWLSINALAPSEASWSVAAPRAGDSRLELIFTGEVNIPVLERSLQRTVLRS